MDPAENDVEPTEVTQMQSRTIQNEADNDVQNDENEPAEGEVVTRSPHLTVRVGGSDDSSS